MTYAIIETGGKQLSVEPGRFYDIELLPVEAEESHTITKVLLVNHDGEVTVGQPFIEGAEIAGTILQHGRGKKILVYKMKPKKKTRKKRGHRQSFTRFMVEEIRFNGTVVAAPEVEAEPVDTEAETATVAE